MNYRSSGGDLLWSLPANNVLWKLDGPFNAGVIVATAAAPSGSITLNDGGVSMRRGGFPSAKLHVRTIASQTEPGEVRVDPGNPNATATIHAVNANMSTTMILETQAPASATSLKLLSMALCVSSGADACSPKTVELLYLAKKGLFEPSNFRPFDNNCWQSTVAIAIHD